VSAISSEFGNDKQFIEHFEGRAGIYIEKGALLVRVSHIRIDAGRYLTAEVEEVPAPGLGFAARLGPAFEAKSPLRWSIGTSLSGNARLSSRHWSPQIHVGWTLDFDPELVSAVVKLASSFAPDLDPLARYKRVVKFIQGRDSA
jgi:hypothetical protein